MQSIFPPAPFSKPDQYEPALTVIQQAGKLQGYDLNQAIDNSLVQSAVDRGLAGQGS